MNRSDIEELVQRKCAEIQEHVDSVQVFVTMHEGGEERTSSYEYGKGNFYARQGQVEEWVTIQRQYQKNYAIRKDEKE